MSKKMQACKSCGQEIAKSAKVCPHCGAKNKKKHPLLIAAIIIVLIAIVGSAGGEDEPTLVGSNASSQATSQTEPVVKQESNMFKVGDTAEQNNVKVSMVSVSETSGSSFNTPTEGNVFVLCEFEIENNSNHEITVSSMMSFEAYCDDYACNYSLGAIMEKENKNQLDGTVAPGKKLNGIIGYEVPVDWQELEIRFTPDFWSGKDIVFIATNN